MVDHTCTQYSGTAVPDNQIKIVVRVHHISNSTTVFCVYNAALLPLCFSQITFKNGRTQIAKGGYPKLKPCSDVDEKTQSKFIGCVHKNTAVSTLRCSLTCTPSTSSHEVDKLFLCYYPRGTRSVCVTSQMTSSRHPIARATRYLCIAHNLCSSPFER